jgi:micrococcal nuclease
MRAMKSLPAILLVSALAFACAPPERDDRDGDPIVDSGVDAGQDAGVDAGVDAGTDAGNDAGTDAGSDGGCRTFETAAFPQPPCVASLPDATCSNGRILTVYQAADGDTLKMTNKIDATHYEHIRLVGVNTPETVDPDTGVQCYGPEASTFTKSVMNGTQICLTYDPAVTAASNNLDAYDRTLGYVFYGPGFTKFLNAELVHEGYAYDYPFTCGTDFGAYFKTLKDGAKLAERGLWGACTSPLGTIRCH